jgi:hypothetical protein
MVETACENNDEHIDSDSDTLRNYCRESYGGCSFIIRSESCVLLSKTDNRSRTN